jgi:hypothetical protein
MLKRKKAGGSVFSLALVAMLILGAVAAGTASASFEEPVWAINGEEFFGKESIKLSKAGPVTLTNEEGTILKCESSEGSGLAILNGEESSGQLVFKKCAFPAYPECILNSKNPNITLTTNGWMGRGNFSLLGEWVGVSGTLALWGECPFYGTMPIGGSLGAALSTNGIAVKKKFERKAEALMGASGFEIDGEPWFVSMEIETILSGANAGKALGIL